MDRPLRSFLDSLVVTSMPPGFDAGGFDCGEAIISEYLCDGTAEADMAASFSQTYLVHAGEELVAYFTVLADAIRLGTKERPDGIVYATAPAVKLGRVGVCKTHQGEGVGQWILQYVVGLARNISDQVGVRYVTLDALRRDWLLDWYGGFGFASNAAEPLLWRAWRMFNGRFRDGDEPDTISMRYDILLERELDLAQGEAAT